MGDFNCTQMGEDEMGITELQRRLGVEDMAVWMGDESPTYMKTKRRIDRIYVEREWCERTKCEYLVDKEAMISHLTPEDDHVVVKVSLEMQKPIQMVEKKYLALPAREDMRWVDYWNAGKEEVKGTTKEGGVKKDIWGIIRDNSQRFFRKVYRVRREQRMKKHNKIYVVRILGLVGEDEGV